MQKVKSADGTLVSYQVHGEGAPLVLVHGGFSDHVSNWEGVVPLLEKQFKLYAVARRGRGETTATQGHSLEDEARDAVSVIDAAGEPVFLLGHSYGAQVALAAAALVPAKVRKLVLYEPPWSGTIEQGVVNSLEKLAQTKDWENFSMTFFRDGLHVPAGVIDELRTTDVWPLILADAEASVWDLHALRRYEFRTERFRELHVPVLLQIGTESPRDLYVTDALMSVLPNARIGELAGQAHEGMTTAPEPYAAAVSAFLLEV